MQQQKEEQNLKLKQNIITNGIVFGGIYAGQCVLAGTGLAAAITGAAAIIPTGGLSFTAIAGGIGTILASLAVDVIGDKAKEYIQKQLRFQVDYIRGIDCDEDEEDDKGKEDDGNKGKTPLPGDINFNHVPAIAKMDPSGYVYEAVPSNRLPGVTTTIYIKHEDDTVEEWDATEYGEVNPQLTNEYGEYGWDVPVGLWQVKYEKAGYVTAYSEWLPVPPPQLDVNMSKVRMEEPTVQDAQGYETGIEIVFDKYMDPSTMTATLINVTQDGTAVSGAITLQNEETDPLSGKSFVSNVRFVPDAPFTLGSEVKLTVVKAVKSYAGVEMTGDFVKTLSIGKEAIGINVTPELEILYNDATTIEVSVEPAEAAAGKRVLARSIAPSIVSVTSDATLDAQGRASLRINAELPGLALIEVSVEGTNLKAEVTVHVVQTKAVAEQTAKPTASIPSGSEVAPQTTVALSSATSGAAIRYTLDGTCPCDGVYLTYTLPIVISEHTVIKAIAVKDDMQESELATFEYFIREDGAPDPDPDEGGNGEGDPDNSDPGDDDTVGTEGVDNILSITPNPIRRSAYNDIIVRVPDNNIYEDYMLHVYTASGALIREIRLSGPNPPVGQLEKGLYIFRLSNKNGQTRLVQKMIVAD